MSGAEHALRRISAVRGVRGAMLVSAPDGLVVSESSMEDVDGRAIAALAASLAGRLRRAAGGAGLGRPTVIQLRGETGTLLAGDRETNLGLTRLELLEAARGIA